MPPAKLLTVPQVAAELQVTAQTIRNWIDHGILPAVRIGRAYRVKRQDVDALLERASGDSTSLATRRDLCGANDDQPATAPRSGTTAIRLGVPGRSAEGAASVSRRASQGLGR
jgi:excisionase family DNA binding protein